MSDEDEDDKEPVRGKPDQEPPHPGEEICGKCGQRRWDHPGRRWCA